MWSLQLRTSIMQSLIFSKEKKTHLFSIEYTTSRVWQFLSAFMQHTCCVLIKCTVKIKDENILNLCL